MDKLDKQYECALWYKNLLATNNDIFMPLFSNQSRYLVLMGGGGSGKSIFAGRKILERVTSEKGHRWLVVRKVARTLRESCYQQLKGQISQHYDYSDWKDNKTDMVMTYKNGSQIIFAGLDDVEKLKSIYNITGIWIEEASEIDEEDLNQLDIRLRGETKYYKQIIISFNPVDINHWLKKRFFDNKIDNATTHHSTYKDNRFLDDDAKLVLEAYKESDPYYYDVYCLGLWGVLGKTIFDKQKIQNRILELKEPVKQGSFLFDYDGLKITNIQWQDDPQGFIKIYQDRKDRYPYVCGGDTAGDGSDNFTAHVLDNTTGAQVAVLKHQFDEDIYARQLYCLGNYYNNALLSPESNFSTYPLKELERLGYPKMYVREREDTFTGGITKSLGFKTTSQTRPIIIAGLVALVRENVELINDRDTLEEMLTFVRNEKGRPQAQNGSHDDLIMGLAISHYIRNQQSYTLPKEASNPIYNFDFEKPKANPLGYGDKVRMM